MQYQSLSRVMDVDNYINKINKSNRGLFKLFKQQLDSQLLLQLNEVSIQTYFVAMTPRSGSSYLMDLFQKTNKLAEPGEYLNPGFVPDIATSLQVNNLVDYWIKLIRRKGSENIFGVKVSYFHFIPLIETGLDELFFKNNKIILLQRKNIVEQAISLYLATQSNIFHTNIEHSEEKWKLLEEIKYSEQGIRDWIEHIHLQELGWEKYLVNKEYLPLWYEDILADPKMCVKKTLDFLALEYRDSNIYDDSIFKKISNDKNTQFYDDFINNKANIEYLTGRKLSKERYITHS